MAVFFVVAATAYRAHGQAKARVLHVSVAADLEPVMPAIAQNYERESGVKLVVTAGSSEKQVARIEGGEPADIFLGGDFTYPEKLVADGLTDAKAPVAYAKNSLVLFALKTSALQPLTLETLQNEHLQSLAIPDPLHTPVGGAASAALTKLKLIDHLKPKLVQTEDVTHAAQLVETGEAQVALLPLSLAASTHLRTIGTSAIIPSSQYPELRQYAVVLRRGDVPSAHQFLAWLLSSDIQTKLSNVGLEPVR